jgi:hypothetical protein
MTPIQLKAARQLALTVGCSSFVLLLILTLLFRGMPSVEILCFIAAGSVFLGFMGFYLGGVISSPIVVKNPARGKRKKSSKQPVEEGLEEAPDFTDNTNLDDVQENRPFEQLQDFIPEEDDTHSEHEWVDTSQARLNDEITINKTKAFEA